MEKQAKDPDWPFADPKNVAAVTTASIVDGKSPILYVSHDEDDGGWQFHTGDTVDMSEAKLVSLYSVVQRDPTLKELADLPLGWEASRSSVGQAWQKRRQ